jgi:uncharacterized heparinase superfamily protein
LSIIGNCFNSSQAKQWLQIGTKILCHELAEQILDDGMHFERSPMYHLRVVYLLKLLHDTGHRELQDIVATYRVRTIETLQKLCHPDGQIALFNDAAFGIYNSPEQLFQNKKNLETEIFQLPDAGYFGARTDTGHYLLCDAGNIGPDYLPGHAHSDIFSFELSFFGKRMIVDSGVYDYVNSPNRKYSRSTAAHNTIEIEGHDQCEFFDAFKVGYRAHPCQIHFETLPQGFRLNGKLHHYHNAVHQRIFDWNHKGILTVIDQINAHKSIEIVSRFHLHPKCQIIEQKNSEILIERDLIRWRLICPECQLELRKFDYSPEFGLKIPATVVQVTKRNASLELQTIIELTK